MRTTTLEGDISSQRLGIVVFCISFAYSIKAVNRRVSKSFPCGGSQDASSEFEQALPCIRISFPETLGLHLAERILQAGSTIGAHLRKAKSLSATFPLAQQFDDRGEVARDGLGLEIPQSTASESSGRTNSAASE